jgi:hypothetical protein
VSRRPPAAVAPYIQGRLKEPLNGKSQFVTTRVDPRFADELQNTA